MKKAAAIIFVIAAVVAMSTSANAMEMPDRIVLKNNSQISNITITSADPTSVKYTKMGGGAADSVKAEDIEEISWGDMPGEVRRAQQSLKKTPPAYEEALAALDKAPAKITRDWWYGPYRRYLQAQCLMELNRQGDAVVKLKELIDGYPQSFYAVEAIGMKANAHLALKQYAEAAETAQKFDPQNLYKDAASVAPYGKIWHLRGRIMMIDAYIATGKTAEASDFCVALTEICDRFMLDMPPELKPFSAEVKSIHQRAIVNRSEILLKDKKLAEAAQWIDNVADKITEPAARIKMFVTYGDIQLQTANAETDRTKKEAKLKQAALAYMKVYILFPDQQQFRAKSMINAAKALIGIGSASDNASAVRLCKEIIETFAGSPEAAEANKLLQAIGVR